MTADYTVIIPAYNEEENIIPTIRTLATELRAEGVPVSLGTDAAAPQDAPGQPPTQPVARA